VMTSIDDERHAGAASGINNAVARAAGLLAIALFGAIAVVVFAPRLDRELAERGAPPPVRRAMADQRLKLADAVPPRDADPHLRDVVKVAIRNAFTDAFRVNMLVAAALAMLSAGGAVVVTPRKRAR